MKITIDTKNDSKEEILKAIELIHHIIHNPYSNSSSDNPSNIYSDYSNANDAFNFSSNSQPQANTGQSREFDIPGLGMNDTSTNNNIPLNNNLNNSNISNSSNYTNSSNTPNIQFSNYPNTQNNNYPNTPNTQNVQNPQPTVYNAASNSNQPLERPVQQITPFNALFGELQTSNLTQQNPQNQYAQNQQAQQSIIVNSFEKETIAKPSTELKREKPKFSVMGFEAY
ncbi:hypothetical protein HY636_05325 [Candidatus Woesearchaeota archaeon]|nr:hypothetical protein [Candidatus Woesearchaeota archaeon]